MEAVREGERGISDQVLIQKAISGNEQAFRLLIEEYQSSLFRTIYAVLRDEKEAEDALQEVFLKVFTSLPRYKGEGFKTWMTRIAVNHAIDMKRKQARRREDMVESALNDRLGSEKEQVETAVMRIERQQLVLQRLDELPDNYRKVIYDFYIQEKTYQQMAEEQQVQVKTIETRIYRARIWMKKHWKEEDFS